MKLKTHILIALGLALLLAGCRSTRQSVKVTPSPAADTTAQVAAPAPQREYTVMTFDAVVEGVSATGQLRVASDSAMWVAVYKLVELGRALATTDSVWVSVPLWDKYFAGTYADLSRMAKRELDYQSLQAMALADDAGEQIARLAAELGMNATVSIKQRKRMERLTFPFRKIQ